jgi:hypothetical protein
LGAEDAPLRIQEISRAAGSANALPLSRFDLSATYEAIKITGIILAIELTDSSTPLLPMLAACFTAMLVPTLLRNAAIYDSLEERIVAQPSPGR